MDFDKITIKEFSVQASIGVFAHEKQALQPVVISLELDIEPLSDEGDHQLNNVVRYDLICQDVTAFVGMGHIELVETLAEEIARICLTYDRCVGVKVAVEKPNAIENAKGVGVQIYRT